MDGAIDEASAFFMFLHELHGDEELVSVFLASGYWFLCGLAS
jgi:hypothetical protein